MHILYINNTTANVFNLKNHKIYLNIHILYPIIIRLQYLAQNFNNCTNIFYFSFCPNVKFTVTGVGGIHKLFVFNTNSYSVFFVTACT